MSESQQPPHDSSTPPDRPPGGMSAGKKVGLGCAGCLVLILLVYVIGILGSFFTIGSSDTGDPQDTRAPNSVETTASEPAD